MKPYYGLKITIAKPLLDVIIILKFLNRKLILHIIRIAFLKER